MCVHLNRNDVCNKLHTFWFIWITPSQVLVRKYLNRIEDRVIPKDESTYITKIGKKLEVKDVMEIDNRYVTLGNKLRSRVKEKKSG